MDETLNDIIVVGKLIYRLGRGITLAAIKAISTAYYSSNWHGRTSLVRLHRIAGSHIGYLEIDTQDAAIFKRTINNTLEKYNVLWAELPDLNLKDGRSQLAFNADQLESVKAALNVYNADRLEKLNELKKKYADNIDEYNKAKKQLEKEMPSIRSVTADDYALTRLDEHGKETEEFKVLAESAKEEMKKEAESIAPSEAMAEQANMPIEDKKNILKEIKMNKENEQMLMTGKAERLEVEDIRIDYININEESVPVYRAVLTDNKSVLITGSEIIDEKSIILKKDKSYRIMDNKSVTFKRMEGTEVINTIKNKASELGKTINNPVQNVVKVASAVRGRTL